MSIPQKITPMDDIGSPRFREKWNLMVDAIIRLQTVPISEHEDPEIPSPGFFPVKLVEVGGASGDYTTACTYIYDVKSLDGATTLAEDMPPEWRPAVPGKLTSGDNMIGQAYYNKDGDLVLFSAAESYVPEACMECVRLCISMFDPESEITYLYRWKTEDSSPAPMVGQWWQGNNPLGQPFCMFVFSVDDIDVCDGAGSVLQWADEEFTGPFGDDTCS